MNIFQVMCFVMLAHVSTFHEAAEKMYVSQSSFSNNIQSIEQQLGVSLVERGARGFKLTEAGRTFLTYAEDIIAEYDRMNDLLEEYKREAKNRLMLFVDPLTSFGYNEMLIAFRQNAPEIQIEITNLGYISTADILSTYENAACIVFSSGESVDPGTRRHTLLHDNLAVLINEENPLAKGTSLTLRELHDNVPAIVASRPASFLYGYVEAQFNKAGASPNISPYALWYSTMIDVVCEMDHAAVIPGKVARIFCRPGMKVLDIVDAEAYSIDIMISETCTHKSVLRLFDFAKITETRP